MGWLVTAFIWISILTLCWKIVEQHQRAREHRQLIRLAFEPDIGTPTTEPSRPLADSRPR